MFEDFLLELPSLISGHSLSLVSPEHLLGCSLGFLSQFPPVGKTLKSSSDILSKLNGVYETSESRNFNINFSIFFSLIYFLDFTLADPLRKELRCLEIVT